MEQNRSRYFCVFLSLLFILISCSSVSLTPSPQNKLQAQQEINALPSHQERAITKYLKDSPVENVGNSINFFDGNGRAQASFFLFPKKFSKEKPGFNTKFLDTVRQLLYLPDPNNPASYYHDQYFVNEASSSEVSETDFGDPNVPMRERYKVIALGVFWANEVDKPFFEANPDCIPKWDIYIGNTLIQSISMPLNVHQPYTAVPVYSSNSGYYMLNQPFKLVRTPATCIKKIENNRLTESYRPFGSYTFTKVISFCAPIDEDAVEYCENNVLPRIIIGDVFSPPSVSNSLEGLTGRSLALNKKIEDLRRETFGTTDFQILAGTFRRVVQKSERDLFREYIASNAFTTLQVQPSSQPSFSSSSSPSISPQAPSPSPTSTETPVPSPIGTPEPTPTPLDVDEPEASLIDENFSSVMNQRSNLESMGDVLTDLAQDAVQKNQSLIDEKINSTNLEDQKVVNLAKERIKRLNSSVQGLSDLDVELKQLEATAIATAQVKKHITRTNSTGLSVPDTSWYFRNRYWLPPAPRIVINQAYFRPSGRADNPYGHELVIHGRFLGYLGLIGLTHLSLSSEVFSDLPQAIDYYNYETSDHTLTSAGNISFSNDRMSCSLETGGFSLLVHKFEFSPEFLVSRGVKPVNLQDPRLFKSVPLKMTAHFDPLEDYVRVMLPGPLLDSNTYVINPLRTQTLEVPENQEAVHKNDGPVFSPRDVNARFDQLNFTVDMAPSAPWRLEVLPLNDQTVFRPLWEMSGIGPSNVPWNGHVENICLTGSEYLFRLVDTDKQNVVAEQPFYMDNTPPIIKELDIDERVLQTVPEEIVETHISFKVEDPLIYEVASGISTDRAKPEMNYWNLQVYVDDAPLFAMPAIDEAGFWVTSLVPDNDLTIDSVEERSARVSFKIRGRLTGRTLRVSSEDRVANLGNYIVYPEGGGF